MTAQVSITREILFDQDADVSWLEGDRCTTDEERAADADRLAAFHAGDWHMTGVRAKAEIRIPHGHDWIVTHLSSPGLWGVESDAPESYLDDIFAEERATLLGMLEHLKDYEIVA